MNSSVSRRDFLSRSATLAGAAMAASAVSNPLSALGAEFDQSTLQVCDTHQHLWDLEKFKLPWLGGAPKSLARNFVMKDYLETTKGLNVTRAVYMEVNVAPEHQVAEAEYVIDLCKRDDNPTVAATIGGSPQSADFQKYIERFADVNYVKGVRTVLHDDDREKGLCLKPGFVKNIRRLGKLGKRWDLCMRPDELMDGAKLADKCPDTKIVLDHCGNLSVQNEDKKLRKKWQKGVKALAERPNVICKISGIIATADKDNWSAADLAPNMNFCMDTFGEDRVIFAGDWPVCTLTAPFGGWLNALKEIVKKRSPEFQKKLFHDNAVKFYELG
jgi:L-fuconolactonase